MWAAVMVCAMGATAWASPGAPLSWSFQDSGFSSGGSDTAVGMRTGRAWPVIFDEGGDAYSLFAVENPMTGTHWHQIGGSMVAGPKVKAKTSADGRVALTDIMDGDSVVSGAAGGWTYLPHTLVAFDAAGGMYTADEYDVHGVPGYTGDRITHLSVSPDGGTVGVIDDNFRYHQHDAWNGWGEHDLDNLGPSGDPYLADLAYDSVGRPHVLSYENNTLWAYRFDTYQGQWNLIVLANDVGIGAPELATSADGSIVATAWVDRDDHRLVYAWWTDTVGWSSATVMTDPNIDWDQVVGIAFDHADLPVISFMKGGNLWLAYDPVPEPTTLTLLGLGGLALLRRRAA